MLGIEAVDDLYKMSLFLGFRDLYEPLHRPFCDFLMSGEWKKKMWLMPRKHFKTSIGTISYVVWRIVRNPKIKILIFSSTRDMAKGFLAGIKAIFETNPNFRARFGDFKGERVWNKNEILVKQAEQLMIDNTYTVETAGVDESVTSKHYDLIIFDDSVSPKNVKNLSQRIKVKEAFEEASESLLRQGGEVLVLGTRWHFDDLYSDIIKSDNITMGGDFKCVVRQAIEAYPVGDMDKNIWQGKVIFPTYFEMEAYKKMSVKKPYIFWANYMNHPRASKDKTFNAETIETFCDDDIRWDKTSEWNQFTDPANGEEEWNCKVAHVQVCQYGNKYLVTDILAKKMETDELVKTGIALANKNPYVKNWIIEDAGGPGGVIAYCQKMLKMAQKSKKVRSNIEIDTCSPAGREKMQRIRQLAPYIKDGTIMFRESYPHVIEGNNVDMMDALMAEMDEFPFGSYVDILDCLANMLDTYDLYDPEDVDYSLDTPKENEYNPNQEEKERFELTEKLNQQQARDDKNTAVDRDTGEVFNLD